jgi:L-threonylcarbamoyladenylate synthase
LALVCQPDEAGIARAVAALREGGIVVFPTETIYGVGVDLLNAAAVRRLFGLKRRSPEMPLMAHCADESQIVVLVASAGPAARKLMKRFWPGPLALVFRAVNSVPQAVTAGTGTLGVRMVAHPAGQKLLSAFGRAIAGSSANISGGAATCRFTDIDQELMAGVDVALDAGVCGDDVPSTVLDVTSEPPRIIRQGAVSADAIQSVVGPLA